MDESCKSELERWLAPYLSAFGYKTLAQMCAVFVAGLIAGACGAGRRTSATTSFIISSPAACGE